MKNSQLDEMSQMDICHINPDTLVSVNNLFIDPSLPQPEKLEKYLSQIRNPYCFLSGETPVRIRFVAPDKPLSQSLLSYFSSLKSTQ